MLLYYDRAVKKFVAGFCLLFSCTILAIICLWSIETNLTDRLTNICIAGVLAFALIGLGLCIVLLAGARGIMGSDEDSLV